MRIATAILAIIMAIVLYDFYNTASLAARITDSNELSGIAGGALIGALLWVVGGVTVYFSPRSAIVIFTTSFVIMLFIQLGASITTDLWVYMWGGLVFAFMSYLGLRSKRQQEEDARVERERQYKRDLMLDRLLSQQAQNPASNQRWNANDPQDHTDRPAWMKSK